MNVVYPRFYGDRYKMSFIDLAPAPWLERSLFIGMGKALEKLPEDAKMETRLERNGDKHKAAVKIRSNCFGCDVEAQASTPERAQEEVFKEVYNEIREWKETVQAQNSLAPYLGGYPSFYKEKEI